MLTAHVVDLDLLLHLVPASWQAVAMRAIVHRAVGDDVVLFAHRTCAIRP